MFPVGETVRNHSDLFVFLHPSFQALVFTWNELGMEVICYPFIEVFLCASAVLITDSLYFIRGRLWPTGRLVVFLERLKESKLCVFHKGSCIIKKQNKSYMNVALYFRLHR